MKKIPRPLLTELLSRLGRATLAYAAGVAVLLALTDPPAQQYSEWCLRRDVYASARSGRLSAGPGPVQLSFSGPPIESDQVVITNQQPRRLALRTRLADGREIWGQAGVPFGLYQVWGVGASQVRFWGSFVLLVAGIVWVVGRTAANLEARLNALADNLGQPLDDPSEVGLLARNLATMQERVEARQRQLERADAELAESMRARNRLLAVVSHELRSPLASVLGHCQMLLDGLSHLPEASRSRVAGLYREAEAMLARADRLLEICRLESGAVEPQVGEVFLSDCLEAACAVAVGLGVELEVEPPPADLVVAGDERALQVVLSSAMLCGARVRVVCASDRLHIAGEGGGEWEEHRLSRASAERMLLAMGWSWEYRDGLWLDFPPC